MNENLESRREAARDASQLISAEIAQFEQQLKTLDAVPTIRQLRDEAELVKAQTAEQARRMLAAGRDPREVVDFLATTLTNRLLHGPSQRLREAAERGDAELLDAARALFDARSDGMKDSIRRKLERLAERHEEVSAHAGRSCRDRRQREVPRAVDGVLAHSIRS